MQKVGIRTRGRGILAIALPAFVASSLGASEEGVIEKLEPIKVTTATKQERWVEETPMASLIITQEEIEKLGASTLREVLENSAGVYVSPGGRGMVMRGLSQDNALFLLDGRRIKGEFSNTYELERIPAGIIERIEIIKGPSSVLYGSDALGGVVNIITKRPQEGLGGRIEVSGGTNSHGKGSKSLFDLQLYGGDERTSFRAYANALDRNPYAEQEVANVLVRQAGIDRKPSATTGGVFAPIRNNVKDSYGAEVDYRDDAEVFTAGGAIRQRLAENASLRIEANYMKEDRHSRYIAANYPSNYYNGANKIMVFNTPAEWRDDNERFDVAAILDWEVARELDLRYTADYTKYKKYRNIYSLIYADLGYASSAASANSTNITTMEQWSHELMATWNPSPQHTLTTGAEYRTNDVESTAYSVNDRNYKSAYAQHEWRLTPDLNLVYGARYDRTSIGENQTSFQGGLIYSLSDKTKLRFNYAQGFKAPDDRVLYVNQINPQGRAMLGSEVLTLDKTTASTLKAESSDTFEAGITTRGERWKYDLGIFKTKVDNKIEQVQEIGAVSGVAYNTFRNVSEAEIKGVENSLGIMLHEDWWIEGAFSYIDAMNKAEDIKLMNVPKTLTNLSIEWTPLEAWSFRLMSRTIGEQYISEEEKVGSFTLVGLKASYSPSFVKGGEIFGGIDNLLDRKVPTILGGDPGLFFYLGARYNF